MLMPFELPAVAAPMVRPVTVTVTAVFAAIDTFAMVATNWVVVKKKKPDGYAALVEITLLDSNNVCAVTELLTV